MASGADAQRPRVGYLGTGWDLHRGSAAPQRAGGLGGAGGAGEHLRDGAGGAPGRGRWAVVPIENSLDGSVTVTLDLLADEHGDLEIVGEALLAVRALADRRRAGRPERDRHRDLPSAGSRTVHAFAAG